MEEGLDSHHVPAALPLLVSLRGPFTAHLHFSRAAFWGEKERFWGARRRAEPSGAAQRCGKKGDVKKESSDTAEQALVRGARAPGLGDVGSLSAAAEASLWGRGWS